MSFVRSLSEIAEQEVKTVKFDDVDMVTIAWRTRKDIVARLLPPPLRPIAEPVAVAFIAHFKSTNYNPPYHEAGLYLRARHADVEGAYCISMLLDDDMAMAIGREMHGYPKKLARLSVSLNPQGVQAFIERRGTRLIDMHIDFTKPEGDPMAALGHLGGPTYTYRCAPAVEGRGTDGRVRLIESTAAATPRAIQSGRAEVELHGSAFDPWAELVIEEVLGAAFVQGSVTVPRDGGRVAAEVAPADYAPYAYAAWDRPFHNFTPRAS